MEYSKQKHQPNTDERKKNKKREPLTNFLKSNSVGEITSNFLLSDIYIAYPTKKRDGR